MKVNELEKWNLEVQWSFLHWTIEYNLCGSSSVGRASAFQAEGRGFESRLPLEIFSFEKLNSKVNLKLLKELN